MRARKETVRWSRPRISASAAASRRWSPRSSTGYKSACRPTRGPGAIRNLFQAYAAHRSDGQTFRQWVEATAEEQLVEFCEPEETDFEAPYMADAKQSWYPFAESESAAAAVGEESAAPSDD